MRKTAGTNKSRRISISTKVVLSFGVLMLACLTVLGCLLFSYLRAQLVKEQDRLIQASFSLIDTEFTRHVEEGKKQALTLFNSKNGTNARNKSTLKETEKISFLMELQKVLNNDRTIHSIYILNRSNVVVLHASAMNMHNYTEDLEELLPIKIAQSESILVPSFWSVKSRYESAPDIPLYSIIIRESIVGSDSYSGALVLNLDLSALADEVFAASKDSQYIYYVLVDQDGRILADSKGQYFGQNISQTETFQRVLEGKTSKHREKIDGVVYESSVIHSKQNGVYIIAWSNYQEQINSVYHILLIIIGIVLIAGGGMFLISYRFSRRMFTPLRSIVEGIKSSEASEFVGDLWGDELQYLEQYYYQISTYVDLLKEKEYKDNIVKNLLAGNSVQQMLLKIGVVKIDQPDHVIMLCIPEEANFSSLEEYSEHFNYIREVINMTLDRFGQCTWFEVSLRRRMLVLSQNNNLNDPNINIDRVLESTFYKSVKSDFLIFSHYAPNGQIELGDIYREIESIRRTRLLLNPTPAVVSCRTIAHGDQVGLQTMSDQLLQYLKEGNKELYLQTMNVLLDNAKNLFWEDYINCMSNLVQSLMVLHDSINVRDGSNENRGQQIIDKLYSIQSRVELGEWFVQLFEKNTYGTKNVNSYSAYGIIETAIEYLNSNYGDPELNTNLLARRLNVSPSYFGKLFKSYTGSSMSEYLTKLRIEKAHNLLLLNTEKDISQIAAEVGYSNSGYFATVFKKYYGVSPSKIQDFYTLQKIENDKQKA